MGLLVWGSSDDVPGTVPGFLERKTKHTVDESELNPNLKYDRSGKQAILLVPQPSDDPNDPLNLPRWKRDLTLTVLCICGVLATTLSPILAANSFSLTFYFNTSFDKIAVLTGYHLLAVGLAGFLFVPLARIWGKRHVYLVGLLFVIASCVWAGESTERGVYGVSGGGYGSLLGARVLQGVGLAPFEALINASVGDLFFVHERGLRMALSNLAVFGGAFFTPVLSGLISDRLGWFWTFRLLAIFTGAAFVLMVFLAPETAYPRGKDAEDAQQLLSMGHVSVPAAAAAAAAQAPGHAADSSDVSSSSSNGNSHEHYAPRAEKVRAQAATVSNSSAPSPTAAKASYWKTLLPFNGRKTDENFFILLIRPLPLFLNPGILWACLIQGALIGWTVLIGIVLAALLLGPPLWFQATEVGFMYTGAFIGALCGFVICGVVSDVGARVMTRMNNGVFEPEFRIPLLVLPQLIFGGIGLYGFGFTSFDTIRYGWLIPDVFFGFEVAGMVCGAVASALYIADAYADVAIEAFTCLLIFKNVFSFGLTYSGYDWLIHPGVKPVFIAVASVQVGICALSIPMYFLGKQNRRLYARLDLLRVFKRETYTRSNS